MARLRQISPPHAIPPPSRISTRTRLHLSSQDELVVRQVGRELSHQAGWVLKHRVALGPAFDKAARARLKRELTSRGLTARMSGSLLQEAMDMWRLGRRNQLAYLRSLERNIYTIEKRLKLSPGEKKDKKGVKGYSLPERGPKRARLACLKAEHERVFRAYSSGHVSIVRGGKDLIKLRHSLQKANLSLSEWQSQWHSAREKISFSGEGGKRYGNETLRVNPESGEIVLRLPNSLAHLANRPHQRYLLDAKAIFSFHGEDIKERAQGNQSIAYTISRDTAKGRVCLDATWQPKAIELIKDTGKTVGLDLNAEHLACWVMDKQGNPCGEPKDIPLLLKDLPTTTRDARLREALSKAIHYAKENRASSIAIEDLGWAEESKDSREQYSKRFRRTIHDIPTAKLRSRAQGMFSRAGLKLIAVDPAYTSKWAEENWLKALQTKRFIVTSHQTASLMISRRALGLSLRRRSSSLRNQRISRASTSLEISLAQPKCSGKGEQVLVEGGRADVQNNQQCEYQKTRVLQLQRFPMPTKGKTVCPSEIMSRKI